MPPRLFTQAFVRGSEIAVENIDAHMGSGLQGVGRPQQEQGCHACR